MTAAPEIYRAALMACLAAMAILLARRWLGAARKSRPTRARLVNEVLWSAIPTLLLLLLLIR